MANPGFDHPVVTAPGMAPEARYAEKEALDRAYDKVTKPERCEQCGKVHDVAFTWRRRTRGWHQRIEDES